MGVNIVLVELVDKKKERHYDYPCFTTKRIEWFDSFRHFGDKEFVRHIWTNGNAIREDDGTMYPDLGAVVLWRVVDFDKCKEWIKENSG